MRVEGQIEQRAIQVEQQRVGCDRAGSREFMSPYDTRRMEMLIDLHTHSHHSDGTLAPAELVARAARARCAGAGADRPRHHRRPGRGAAGLRRVGHRLCHRRGGDDRLARPGTARGGPGCRPGVQRPAGSTWPASLPLRRARIAAIRAKLQRYQRLADCRPGAARAGIACGSHAHCMWRGPSRRRAWLTSVQDAFDRFLGRGCQGYVPQEWPHLAPARWRPSVPPAARPCWRIRIATSSRPARCATCAREFRDCGGAALEISLPAMSPNDAARLASLAREHELAGSAGSDFHEPGLPWRPLGRFAKLAGGVEPLLPRLRVTGNRADGMSEDSEDNVNRELFRNIEKLRQLRIEHRDLDQVISRLAMDIHTDEAADAAPEEAQADAQGPDRQAARARRFRT